MVLEILLLLLLLSLPSTYAESTSSLTQSFVPQSNVVFKPRASLRDNRQLRRRILIKRASSDDEGYKRPENNHVVVPLGYSGSWKYYAFGPAKGSDIKLLEQQDGILLVDEHAWLGEGSFGIIFKSKKCILENPRDPDNLTSDIEGLKCTGQVTKDSNGRGAYDVAYLQKELLTPPECDDGNIIGNEYIAVVTDYFLFTDYGEGATEQSLILMDPLYKDCEYLLNDYLKFKEGGLPGAPWVMDPYQMMLAAARGIAYVHTKKQVVHLDMKPSNMMLNHDPTITPHTELMYMIIDWGSARDVRRTLELRKMPTIVYSPLYAAPGKFI